MKYEFYNIEMNIDLEGDIELIDTIADDECDIIFMIAEKKIPRSKKILEAIKNKKSFILKITQKEVINFYISYPSAYEYDFTDIFKSTKKEPLTIKFWCNEEDEEL